MEKCYSIFICRDDIPKEARYRISFYEMVNTKNICIPTVEKETYDLVTLAIIKLGAGSIMERKMTRDLICYVFECGHVST